MPRRPAARPLHGKVALVTGAGVRVGRAIALALGQAGAHVAVHHARSARQAAQVVESLRAMGVKAQAFPADLRDPQAPATLVSDVRRWGGRLDVLVCSAAGFERRPLVETDDAVWEELLALNLGAPFRLARAAATELQKRRGVVVNILDVAAFSAWKGFTAHCVSKAGLAMLTRCLALELAPRARACGVAPGTVAFPDDYPAEDRARIVGRIPLGRVGHPDDVARAVVFLATNDYLSGSVIAVDGGRLAGVKDIL